MAKRQPSGNARREFRKKVNALRKAHKLPQNWSVTTRDELNQLEKYRNNPITQDRVIQVANDRFGNDDILNKLLELSIRTNLPVKIEVCNLILGIQPQPSR